MALEMKQLDCPSCGASLEVKNAQRAKSIVCQQCGSQIDLTDPQFGILGQIILNAALPRTPVQLGMIGEFAGEKYQVIGRVRYREQQWMWDEWLLMTEEGRFKWLTEGEEGFTLYDTMVPTNPVDPREVGDTLNLEGTVSAEVEGRGVGRIDYLEGELTWKATLGDSVHYMDANFPDNKGKYAIEWTDEEVEFFKGKKLTNNEVRRAFSLPELAGPRQQKHSAATVFVIVVVVVVFLCLCAALAMVGGSGDEDSEAAAAGVTATPRSGWGIIFLPGGSSSTRSSSPGGRSPSSGGGSSGGGGK